METFLYREHLKLNAKMVDFAKFQMPLKYTSIIEEHKKVRGEVGVFDISHMGLFEMVDRKKLEFLSTNNLPKDSLTSIYTTFCHEEGGCLDDVIIYKWSDEKYWIIGNALNRDKDLNQTGSKLLSDQLGIIAVQGPKAAQLLGVEYRKNHFIEKEGIMIAGTGYTGEEGFECIAPFDRLKALFLNLIHRGATPCGLGCRDSLRLEMGYALYGHELDETISPLESVSQWAVKLKKDFFGKARSMSLAKRHSFGIKLIESGVPRHNYRVFKNNHLIGKVTSGTFSPMLDLGIALILVDQQLLIGERVEVEIRGKRVLGEVATLPFYKKG